MLLNGQDNSPIQISDIFAAEANLRRVFPPSPLFSIELLNQQLGTQVYLKAESLLPSGAYKYRGAVNKITSLIAEYGSGIEIITASSGNHVPTPQIKKDCIRGLGAELLEIGQTYDESFLAASRIAEERSIYYVHPVADRATASGQGTISLEILDQCPDVDQVIVPIGGGGLITGIAFAMKTLKPSVRIVGVMPEGSAVYVESRKQGKLVTLDTCASMADRGTVPVSVY